MLTHTAAAQRVRAFAVVITMYVVSTPFRMNKSFCGNKSIRDLLLSQVRQCRLLPQSN